MKAIYLLLFGGLLSLNLSSRAQIPTLPRTLDKSDSIDQVKYRILYRLDFVSDPTDRDYITRDIVRLDIGNKVCKEYSERLYRADSLAKSTIEAGKFAKPLMDLVPPIVLYKGYPEADKITVDYRLPSKAPVMTYIEAKPVLQWKLLSDKKEILGYNCQKAEVSFAGRQWVAWFTQEIPLPEGPYKFGGLFGLILQLSDTERDYVYTCIGISKGVNSEPIVRWQWNQRKTNKKDLDKIILRLYANPDQALKALGSPTHFAGDPMLNLPYNPIEK